MQPAGPPVPAPRSLVLHRTREHSPGGGTGPQPRSQNAGKAMGVREALRTVADPQRGKKKSRKRGFFRSKLLGSEKPRFREMSRGGRTHDVPSTLLASAGPAHRGCAPPPPAPGAAGAGPRGAARHLMERVGPPGSPECAPQLPAAAVHARALPPVPRVPRWRGEGAGLGVGAEGLWFPL